MPSPTARQRFARPCCLAALLLLASAAAARPEFRPDTRPDFQPGLEDAAETSGLALLDASLAKVKEFMDRAKWKKAGEALDATIEEYADSPWFLTRVGEVRDRLRAVAFWRNYDRPEADDVLLGRVKSYSSSTGKIEIRYEWEKGTGIERQPYEFARFPIDGGIWVHPAPFSGDYSIEARSKGFKPGCRLYGCATADGDLVFAEFDNTSLSSLHRYANESVSLLESTSHIFNTGRRTNLALKIDKRRIRATINGKNALEGKRVEADAWGQCALGGFAPLEEVVIKGQVDTGWIEGLIDAEIQSAWDDFQVSFDPNQALPKAVRALIRSRHVAEEEPTRVYPGEATPGLTATVDRFWARLDENDVDGARSILEQLGNAPQAELFRRWMLVWIDWGEGRTMTAIEGCEAVITEAPDFYWAHHLRAAFRSSLVSRAEVAEDCRSLVALFPTRPEPYDRLAAVLIGARDTDGARSVLASGIMAGCSPDALEERRIHLIRAIEGPTWNRPHEWKSRHYLIRSDMQDDQCFEASDILEDAYGRWNSHLRRVPKASRKGRASVYLFAGEAGYHAYTKEVLDREAENSLGVYVPSLGQLLIWSGRDRLEWERTIRHEGFHQYLDQLAPTAPIWIHEGLAEYYSTGEKSRGRWIKGQVFDHYVETLRNDGLVPLEQFLRLDPRGFMRNPGRNYAQAWAFVHFLLHGKKHGNKKRFDTYLDALIEGRGSEEALAEAFAGDNLAELDADLRRYLKGLKQGR